MVIYAGYVVDDESASSTVSEPTKDDITVTITENATDKYTTDNDVEMVRFNTQINIAGAKESDPNIRNVAVLYYNLPTHDSNGTEIDWTNSDNIEALKIALKTDSTIKSAVESHLAKLDGVLRGLNDGYAVSGNTKNYVHSTTKPVVTINITNVTFASSTTAANQKAKIDCYAYEIVEEFSGNAAAAQAAGEMVLTNKNRMQFTWYMTLEDYKTKPFLAFAAIKYVADDGNDYAANGNGNKGSNWVVSDNFVTNAFKAIQGIQSSGSTDESFMMKKLAIYTSESYDPDWASENDSICDDSDDENGTEDSELSEDLEESADADSSETETVTEESNDSQTETETVTEDNLTSEPETVTESAPAA